MNISDGVCKSINLKYVKAIKTATVNNKTLFKTLLYDGSEYVIFTEWSLTLLSKFNPGDDLNFQSLAIKLTIDDQYMINYNKKNVEFEKWARMFKYHYSGQIKYKIHCIYNLLFIINRYKIKLRLFIQKHYYQERRFKFYFFNRFLFLTC